MENLESKIINQNKSLLNHIVKIKIDIYKNNNNSFNCINYPDFIIHVN